MNKPGIDNQRLIALFLLGYRPAEPAQRVRRRPEFPWRASPYCS